MFAKSSVESARLARELAGLLELGYSVVEALGKLETTCEGPFQQRIGQLTEQVRAGAEMGEALKNDPGPFPSTFVESVALAEKSQSDLPRALILTAETLEETSEHVTDNTLAAVYPAVVATFLVFLFWVLIASMSSGLESFYNVFPSDSNVISRLYFTMGHALRHPLAVFVVLVGLVGVWKFFTGVSPWRFRLPIYGAWLSLSQTVIFLRWCDHLLKLGLPLPEALRLAATACAAPIDSFFHQAADRVEQGDSLSKALSDIAFLPPMAAWLIEQEESRETLDLRSVADFLSCELDTTQARGTASIEPIALMAIGATILFVCVATQSALRTVLETL